MSNSRNQKNSFYQRFKFVLGLTVVACLLPWFSSEAFQIRDANNLRVMKSKPYTQSTSFRVNADMFVEPNRIIRSSNLVTQVLAPIPGLPTSQTENSGGENSNRTRGNDSSEKYDASDWILLKKYNELVRERDENQSLFLTSAPENPELKFDYFPPNPDSVEAIDLEGAKGMPIPEPILNSNLETQTQNRLPQPVSNSDLTASVWQEINNNLVNNGVELVSKEQVLFESAIDPARVMRVPLTLKQKQVIEKNQANQFFQWGMSQNKSAGEAFQPSAPNQTTIQNCPNGGGVLWWGWCEFVVFILLLIVFLLLISLFLQMLLYRLKAKPFTPENQKSILYHLKKILQRLGLLSLVLFGVFNQPSFAQTTTTPQLLIYEGELLDNLGVSVTGSFDFRFSFWDNGDYEATDVVGGVIDTLAPDFLGWIEEQTTTTPSDGTFSLLLSEVVPFVPGLFDRDNLYLQVEVKNSGDPVSAYEFVDINLNSATEDRKVIASVPFAFNANKLDYRDLGFGSGNIPYLDIAGLLPESIIPDLNLTASDLNLTDITLSDFTNDVGFLSTVDISDDTNLTAGTGLTLTDDTLSVNLGTDIETAEIQNGAVTVAKIGGAGNNQVLTSDGVGNPQWEDRSNFTISALTTDHIFVGDGTGTAVDTPVSGDLTMIGGNFQIKTDVIGSTEIVANAVQDSEIDYSQVTLSDFTNDAGFVTTDNDTLNALNCATDEIARWNGTAWVCAGASTSITQVLSPRYPHSIFEADGTDNTGSMFEEQDTLASGIVGTILRWFSRQSVLNDYDVIVQWTVPDDFDSFQTPALSLDFSTTGLATDAVIDLTVERNDDGIDELSASGVGLNSNTWASNTFTLNPVTTWNAGDTLKIRLRLKAKDSNSAQTGNIKINYITQ